eukprot:3456879-Pyramimonas_sp.AAC.1
MDNADRGAPPHAPCVDAFASHATSPLLQGARGSVAKHGWPCDYLANLNKVDPVPSQTTGATGTAHDTCKA